MASLGAVAATSTSPSWEKCINITVLGPTCLLLDVDPANLTLIAELTISGHVVLREAFDGNQLCLNDNTLLALLDLICTPCAPVIKDLEKLFDHIPGSILSVCLVLTNVTFTDSSVSGEAALDSTILCWKDHCVYQGVNNFGSFDIHW